MDKFSDQNEMIESIRWFIIYYNFNSIFNIILF
jgi:hypothetical protein